MKDNSSTIQMASEIVAAYSANNPVAAEDLPALIEKIHATLLRLKHQPESNIMPKSLQTPAVPIDKSVSPNYIICLEDGQKFKSLKRHLRSKYDMSPEQYREKWGLPPDYPMVAKNYAAARSRLAKQIGLGQKKSARAN